jgi:uncharacterized NAD(P)/FAD-binding protein YdhS
MERRAGSPGTVVVVGGGFSGLLTALHLLANDPGVTVRIVEKADRFGTGRAYAAGDPDHLLNVRASNMSAFPDRPDHFLRWLRDNAAGEDGFVSRRRYGEYLQGLLRDAVGSAGQRGRLLLEQDEALGLSASGEVRLALGRSLRADAVVLATGLAAPAPPDGPGLEPPQYVRDPWRLDPEAVPAGAILLLGTGLTMVDVALSLDRPDRRFVALSRRGLLPLDHGPAPLAPLPSGPLGTPAEALGTLRDHSEKVGWRAAVDSLRPLTPAIWAAWDDAARRRFLRHGRAWWDIHRHRMAPRVAAKLAGIVEAGRLTVFAGRILDLRADGTGLVEAALRRRGRHAVERRAFAAVINCTGLSGDLFHHPLFRDLEAKGLARADDLGLGIDVDPSFRAIGRDGRVTPRLYAVGPLTRGARWETVAVPDLRNQTHEVAAQVLEDLRSGR